ncbi:hypothetical protein DFH09DRAFT_1339213 [Mycena vulgaris]|nr:hypothetical protein DFH09DRAFT_1339213 [Mycena vulgaris]
MLDFVFPRARFRFALRHAITAPPTVRARVILIPFLTSVQVAFTPNALSTPAHLNFGFGHWRARHRHAARRYFYYGFDIPASCEQVRAKLASAPPPPGQQRAINTLDLQSPEAIRLFPRYLYPITYLSSQRNRRAALHYHSIFGAPATFPTRLKRSTRRASIKRVSGAPIITRFLAFPPPLRRLAPRHAINAPPKFKFWISCSPQVAFAPPALTPAHINFAFGLPASAVTAALSIFIVDLVFPRAASRFAPPPSGQWRAINTPPRAPTLWIYSPRKRRYTYVPSRVLFIPLLTSRVQFALPPAAITPSHHERTFKF